MASCPWPPTAPSPQDWHGSLRVPRRLQGSWWGFAGVLSGFPPRGCGCVACSFFPLVLEIPKWILMPEVALKPRDFPPQQAAGALVAALQKGSSPGCCIRVLAGMPNSCGQGLGDRTGPGGLFNPLPKASRGC